MLNDVSVPTTQIWAFRVNMSNKVNIAPSESYNLLNNYGNMLERFFTWAMLMQTIDLIEYLIYL